MNRAQTRQRIEQQCVSTAAGMDRVAAMLAACSVEYDRLLESRADPEILLKLAQVILDGAKVHHKLAVTHAEALVKLAAQRSRFGSTQRASRTAAALLPITNQSRAGIRLWEHRLAGLVTTPARSRR